jgi:hypothetical protein
MGREYSMILKNRKHNGYWWESQNAKDHKDDENVGWWII